MRNKFNINSLNGIVEIYDIDDDYKIEIELRVLKDRKSYYNIYLKREERKLLKKISLEEVKEGHLEFFRIENKNYILSYKIDKFLLSREITPIDHPYIPSYI